MKFLCLCHYDEARFAALTADDFAKIGPICAPRDKALHDSGHLVLVGSLGPAADYAVIHAGDNGSTVSKGPYARTPEPFGAFFILDAENLEQAIEIASLHPGAHLGRYVGGGIEVRPCDHFVQPAG
jgi:hypothetical protein